MSRVMTKPHHNTLDQFDHSYQVSPDILLKFGISNITDKKFWNWTTVSGKTINDPNLEMFVEPGREFNAEVKYTF